MNYGIIGTGAYLPQQRITNNELADHLDIDPSWITRKTGIHERRAVATDEATSDCSAHAAEQAMRHAGVSAEDINVVVVGTSTPDSPQPSTAALVQNRLEIVGASAFDLNAVCTSFIYGLETAYSILTANTRQQYALVIGADTYTRVVDYDDRRTAVLLGDGAGAVVLGPVDDGSGVLASRLRADGQHHEFVRVPAGGSRMPVTEKVLATKQHLFKMQGREVAGYVKDIFPALLAELLDEAGLRKTDLALVISHQANGRLLEEVADQVDIPAEKMHTTVERYGNTGAASVPITLHDAVAANRLAEGDLVALVAFGGGMTAGGVILRWSESPRKGRVG